MEDVITKRRKNQFCSQAIDLEPTPNHRLHTVEEFMTKLEQAVLERL